MEKIKNLFLAFMLLNFACVHAQQSKVSIYNPNADARAEVNEAVTKAALENKHVLIQVGGNWCPWCVKLNGLFHSNQTLDSLLKADYIFVHLNYSKENKNLPILQELDFPQRFGFPVLVVLDKAGKRLHTQDTGLLESGDGYDVSKIISVLKGWTVTALDPKNY